MNGNLLKEAIDRMMDLKKPVKTNDPEIPLLYNHPDFDYGVDKCIEVIKSMIESKEN